MLKLLKDGWIIVGLTLALLLIIDAALKALLPDSALPTVEPGAQAPDRQRAPALNDEPWVDDYFSELRQARKTQWSPWDYWSRKAFEGRYINIDERGVRRSWEPQNPRRTIWMMGGSTVWGTGARDEFTLPSALSRELSALGRATRVVNLGESGYVSGQSQIRFLRRLESEPAPDLVIFYDGVNDVFAALQAGLPGLTQNESHRRADFRVTDGLDNYLQAAPKVLEGIGRALARSATLPHPEVDTLAEGVARAYATRVRATSAVAQATGIPALFYWQPSVFSKTPLHASEKAIVAASLARHQALQLASNSAVEAALDDTPEWRNLGAALNGQPQPLLMDFCHLSEAGNQQVAKQIAGQVLELLDSD